MSWSSHKKRSRPANHDSVPIGWLGGDVDFIIKYPSGAVTYQPRSDVLRRGSNWVRLRDNHRSDDNRITRLGDRTHGVTISVEVSRAVDRHDCAKGFEMLMNIVHGSEQREHGPQKIAYVAFWARILGLEEHAALRIQVSEWTTKAMNQVGKFRHVGPPKRVKDLNWNELDQIHYVDYLFTAIVFSDQELFAKAVRSIGRGIKDVDWVRENIFPLLPTGIKEVVIPVLYSICDSRVHILGGCARVINDTLSDISGGSLTRETLEEVLISENLDRLPRPDNIACSINDLRARIIRANDRMRQILPHIRVNLNNICHRVLDDTMIPAMPSFTGAAYARDAALTADEQLQSRLRWQEDADRNKWSLPRTNSSLAERSPPPPYSNDDRSRQRMGSRAITNLDGMDEHHRIMAETESSINGAMRDLALYGNQNHPAARSRSTEDGSFHTARSHMSNRTIRSSHRDGYQSASSVMSDSTIRPMDSASNHGAAVYRDTSHRGSTIRDSTTRSRTIASETPPSRRGSQLTSAALDRLDNNSPLRESRLARDRRSAARYDEPPPTRRHRERAVETSTGIPLEHGFYFEGEGRFRIAAPGLFGQSRRR